MKKKGNEFSDEQLKHHMALPVKQKLAMLEKMNSFFSRFMPAQNKKIWKQLKQEGF